MSWTPKIGAGCTFYHEGGHGSGYWSNGWRYGIIRETPTKGQYKNHYRLEIPVKLYGRDPATRRYYLREPLMVWVHMTKVNAPMDFVYHGPALAEEVKQRSQEKAAQQKAADKKKPTKRFVRA